MTGLTVRGPLVRGPIVRGPLVVLIVTSNVRADSCIIVLTLYRDKLPRGVIKDQGIPPVYRLLSNVEWKSFMVVYLSHSSSSVYAVFVAQVSRAAALQAVAPLFRPQSPRPSEHDWGRLCLWRCISRSMFRTFWLSFPYTGFTIPGIVVSGRE